MSGVQRAAASQQRRRTWLFLEVLPIAAGFALLLEELVSYLIFSLPPQDEYGRTWYWTFSERAPLPVVYLTDYLLLALAFAVMVALIVFLASGVGWTDSGRVVIGLPIMFVRGFVSLGVLAYFLGEAGPFQALMYFVPSMALAACSALALALVTRPRASPV